MFPIAQQNVSITIDLAKVLYWSVIGLVAGVIAGFLVRDQRFGWISGIVLGLFGSVVGGFLFTILDISITIRGIAISGAVRDIIAAFFGAVILLLIYHAFFGYRYFRRY